MMFLRIFGDFGLWDTSQEWIVPKPIEIDTEKLWMKFSALNVERRRFQWFKSWFARFKETCARGRQTAVLPWKSLFYCCWLVCPENGCRLCMGMLPITTCTSGELFSCINIVDFERPWTSKIRVFKIDFCDLRLQHMLQEWTVTKWLEIDRQFANRNCYRLLRVSWALA